MVDRVTGSDEEVATIVEEYISKEMVPDSVEPEVRDLRDADEFREALYLILEARR